MDTTALAQSRPDLIKAAPQRDIAKARDCWFAGEFEECLEALGGLEPRTRSERVETALLRARALLRLGRADEALHALVLGDRDVFTGDERTSFTMLRGIAAIGLGDLESANQRLVEAWNAADQTHETIRAEVAYGRALLSFHLGEIDTAERLLKDALDPRADIVYVRALDLAGYVSLSRGQIKKSGRKFAEALEALDATAHRDLYLASNLIEAAVECTTEALDFDGWQRLEARLRSYVPPSTRVYLVSKLKLRAAEIALISGKREEAWTWMRGAREAAESAVDRIASDVAFARWHRQIGETVSASCTLDSVLARVDDFSRERWTTREAEVLLSVVIEAACQRRDSAKHLLERYHQQDATDTYVAAAEKDRLRAIEAVATSLIEAAYSGRSDASILDSVIRNLEDSGLAMTASNLSAVRAWFGAREPQFGRYQSKSPMDLRDSCVRGKSEKHEGALTLFPELSQAESMVVAFVCGGESLTGISLKTGKSEHTIRNQFKSAQKKLGLHKKSELLVEYQKRFARQY